MKACECNCKEKKNAGERAPTKAPVEAQLREDTVGAFATPGTEASDLPRVLLIGDSISIGYTEGVRCGLQGVADVSRPPVNCQHSAYGLGQMHTWLGTGRWRVIHFNFGIWDTHLLDGSGNIVSESASPLPSGIRIRHTPEQYRANLKEIVRMLQKTGAALIWASSTPIMSRTGARFEAIPTLNGVAAEVMRAHQVSVNDLYTFVLPHVREWQDPDQCHFRATGNQALARQVSACVQRALA